MATRATRVKQRFKRRFGRRMTFIQESRLVLPEQKALYHHVLGAGKSRVTREFFDISRADLDEIVKRLDQSLARRIAASR
jgi:hypothetical protein